MGYLYLQTIYCLNLQGVFLTGTPLKVTSVRFHSKSHQKVLSVRIFNRIWLDWNDVSLPSHCWTNGWQPLKTIVTNGWLSEKPLKNHWHQWLSWYHSINGNGDPKNHWFLAMVLNFLLYFLAKAKIKQDFKKYVDNMF